MNEKHGTTHFVKQVQSSGKVPPHALLVTLDVMSLHTNIPQQEAFVISNRLLHAKRLAVLKPFKSRAS